MDTGKQVQTRSATEGETLPSTTAAAAAKELKASASKGNRQLVAILVHNLHQSQIKNSLSTNDEKGCLLKQENNENNPIQAQLSCVPARRKAGRCDADAAGPAWRGVDGLTTRGRPRAQLSCVPARRKAGRCDADAAGPALTQILLSFFCF